MDVAQEGVENEGRAEAARMPLAVIAQRVLRFLSTAHLSRLDH